MKYSADVIEEGVQVMASELAFALINPYTIAKSRTGGVIGRLMSRTGLELVAVRLYGPSRELSATYAESLRKEHPDPEVGRMLSAYVTRVYTPDPETGLVRRVMLLLFEGENAIQKVREATGHIRANWIGGETIRDTYGDYIMDPDGSVRYFEPAVLVGPTVERAAKVLRLWASYADSDGGLIDAAADVPMGDEGVQHTLVLLKPDNFRFPSVRPGHIIDLLSRSGLRIIGIRKIRMTVAQAEEFYGPVHDVLREKFRQIVARQAGEVLSRELNLEVSEDLKALIGEHLGPAAGDHQFEEIIRFMTGHRPCEVAEADKAQVGSEDCLALVYKGMSAVEKIRSLLGATDPAKAQLGSVRREYGHDIMVNAAHASDSPENALREMRIINVAKDNIREWVDKYYGSK
ncbi:MAG: nucleoside-diphosphate kinase [bacterium]